MPRPLHLAIGLSGLALASFMGCSASNDGSTFNSGAGGDSSTSGETTASATATSSSGEGGGFDPTTVGSGGSGTGNTCSTPGDVDDDGDGFTDNEGDCNDCDPNVNPGSIEVLILDDGNGNVPEPADEDCDGIVDNIPDTCDDNIGLTDFDPYNGAKVIDLCQTATAADKKWGVLDAKYVRAAGPNPSPSLPPPNALQVGVFDTFGPNVNPQGGAKMLSLSSGYGRRPGDSGACNDYSCSTVGAGQPPNGFPQDVANCFGSASINDDVALEVKLRAPKNATGFSYLFDFYSFEYPEWVCTSFNDQYIALVTPAPAQSVNGNISFDSQNNPVSVNIAFFDVCQGCALGTSELYMTGFGNGSAGSGDANWGQDAGATGWLQTQAPITGGDEFTIRFAIWDTGDTAWDSTVLVDGFQWIANGGTVAVGTVPVEDPK